MTSANYATPKTTQPPASTPSVLKRRLSKLALLFQRGRTYRKNHGWQAFLRMLLSPGVWLARIRSDRPGLTLDELPRNVATTRIADRLWGGFSTYAEADLNAILWSPTASKNQRLLASWEMARWKAHHGYHEGALQYLRLMPSIDSTKQPTKGQLLLEVDSLLQLGRRAEAEPIALLNMTRFRNSTDSCLMAANVLIDSEPWDPAEDSLDERRLALINHMYTKRGLLPVRKIDAGQPLTLDNITASAPGSEKLDGPKVTVIMPAYNSAETIGFALRSVQEQTWRNLEIIVVDDASTDDTPQIVQAIAARDPRITLIRLDDNGGPYVARNRGLASATGEFITVHDGDDWSHAQQIQLQVEKLLSSNAIATLSSWTRTSLEMRFNGSWRAKETLLDENLSSFTLRKAAIDEFGGWDPVRVGADRELIMRVETKFGASQTQWVHEDIPLAFALERDSSLTRSAETHVRTAFYGMRATYGSAYRRWHARALNMGDFRIDPNPVAQRRFPAPSAMLVEREKREYDLVLVTDLGNSGGAFITAYQYLIAATRAKLRTAVFHWPAYRIRPATIDGRILTLIDDFKIDQIVPEDRVHARHVLVPSASILQYRPDRTPVIDYDNLHIIVDQVAAQLPGSLRDSYDPYVVRRNLEAAFGSSGTWWPVSPLLRQQMALDPRYPAPGQFDWLPLQQNRGWADEPLGWRGATRETPVIGRHALDDATKWPQSRETLEQAYCIREGWETRLMGGADAGLSILGSHPQNWRISPADSVRVLDFLRDLDFLVHFPHEDYPEGFSRPVMEAMAAGVPVVLPHRFAVNFGEAAVYCEPHEVADNIKALWANESRYLAQAEAGRQFFLANCTYEQLPRRLRDSDAGPRKPAEPAQVEPLEGLIAAPKPRETTRDPIERELSLIAELREVNAGPFKHVMDAISITADDRSDAREHRWLDRIEMARDELYANQERIAVGIGERQAFGGVGEVSERRSVRPVWGTLLFQLIRRLKPESCLELGTAVGISGAFQTAGLEMNGAGKLLTIEGSPEVAALAEQTFQRLGLTRVIVRAARFQDALDDALEGLGRVDFSFIDGHHDKLATIDYFHKILDYVPEQGVLVFDDIYWSAGMQEAWQTVIEHERVRVALDLKRLGIAIVDRPDTPRTNLTFTLLNKLSNKANQERRAAPAAAGPAHINGAMVV